MFERVTIVGVGLLGASLGLALKQRKLAKRVVGVGRKGSASLELARVRGAIDESFEEVGAGATGSDLVVLCTPIRQFPGMMESLKGVLKPGAIVTDVGSTKGEVMAWAREFFDGSGAAFVGSHPMAGSEKRGPEHGRADLYEGAVCLLCGDGESPAMAKVEAMWRALGMRTLRLGEQEHDRWVATISHLPHAVAFSLVSAAAREPAMLQAVAGGFLDTTRVASSDVDLWTDIFLTNRTAVAAAIDVFAADLEKLKQAIVAGDEGLIRAAIGSAKTARDELLRQRGGK